jgi:peroxiredoxin
MKYIYQFARIFTGVLFIFSGLVKLNDPAGFSIKLNEYFDVFAQDVSTKQDSVKITCSVNQKELINQTFTIYAFDKIKKVDWHINPTKNDFPPPSMQYEVFGQWGGASFISEGYIPSPAKTATFQISIHNQIIHKQIETFDTSNSGIKDFEFDVDLSKYAKQESWFFGFFKDCKAYSLYFSLFFCALEVVLGFAMIIAWRMNLTLSITALLILFFTFLTGYSAYFNKVTDCGCFGDFLKLKPWDSFKKDLVLCVMIILMYLGLKHYKGLFDRKKGSQVMLVLTILTFLFGYLCYIYLPVWDFLPYKKGNNIKSILKNVPTGQRATDSIVIKFVMQKGNDSMKVSSTKYAEVAAKGYTFKRQDRQVVLEGYKSPIHDFAIFDQVHGIDLTDTFLNSNKIQILFVMPFIETAYTESMNEVAEIALWAKKKGYQFYGISSASLSPAKAFTEKYKLPFTLFAADQKMLMTMARYNSTLYLFNEQTVINKWSARNLPNLSQLEKQLSKE